MSEARAFLPNDLAPWAEIVPGAGPMSDDDLFSLPDEDWQYELVEGVLVRMTHSGRRATRIARRLAARLGDYVDEQQMGEVSGADGGFTLRPRTTLAPDVGFIRADRLPPLDSPEADHFIAGAPDLAVEVASPNQYRPGMAAKAQRYLAAGTRLVWVIWPRHQRVDVWRAGDTGPSVSLGVDDLLDGEDVVPGFTYPVARLFT